MHSVRNNRFTLKEKIKAQQVRELTAEENIVLTQTGGLLLSRRTNRRAFTLIELIIVISLIAILYGVFVQKLQSKSSQKNRDVTLKTLKQALSKAPKNSLAEFVCLEPCGECLIYLDNEIGSDTKIKLFKSDPTVYKVDQFGQLQSYEFPPILTKEGTTENVCFRFALYPNGSTSEYAVEYQKKYYLYNPYDANPTVVTTMAEATDFFDREKLLPMEQRDYNF